MELHKVNSNYTFLKEIVDSFHYWGKKLSDLGMAPFCDGYGWAGNIGYRASGNIVIVTASGSALNNLTTDDLSCLMVTDHEVMYSGKKPTSELEIYLEIFKRRQDVHGVLHGHDQRTLDIADLLEMKYPKEVAITKSETAPGSKDFRDEISKIITPDVNYLIGRGHGFFSLGKDLDSAGVNAVNYSLVAHSMGDKNG